MTPTVPPVRPVRPGAPYPTGVHRAVQYAITALVAAAWPPLIVAGAVMYLFDTGAR